MEQKSSTDDDFWTTVNGGIRGYLFRCQEKLRLDGVNPTDKKAVEKALRSEVYTRFQEASDLARAENPPQTS